MLRLSLWYKIFWTPTTWSETCVAVLHSLFSFILTMRLRGISWSLLRGPMRAIVLDHVITLAAEKLFGHGQEDDVSVMAWRSFKLPRKTAGSNNGETQALAFADETLWLARLAWSEMHGAPMRRWHLDEALAQVTKHAASRNNALFPMLVFTGSTL